MAAALLGPPLVACDDGTAPPPVGETDGTVAIEGQGVDDLGDVTVTLTDADDNEQSERLNPLDSALTIAVTPKTG